MNIVIFSGAGISLDSGIPSMDDPSSIFMKYPEYVTLKNGWENDWSTFQKFWTELEAFLLSPNIKPNQVHKDIVELENLINGKLTIITTNIDDLHTRAGSKNVLHIHGTILEERKIDESRSFPNCVLFGEDKRFITESKKAIIEADLFVSIGSSLATGDLSLLMLAKDHKVKTIEINPNETWYSDRFDEVIRLEAKKGIKKIIKYI